PAAGAGNCATARSLSAAGTAPSRHRRALRLAQRTRARSPHDSGRITFLVPLPSPAHWHPARQPVSVPTHLCLGHGTRRDQPARAHAVDGSRRHPDHPALCADRSARRLPAVCARGGAAPSSRSEDLLMNRPSRLPLQHPLAPAFDRSVDSLGAALSPDTTRHYRGTVRNFLSYLGAAHPEVNSLDQLRREPHLLGWMFRLRSQSPPLVTASYINRLIALRAVFTELAWTQQPPQLAHLIRREDIPHHSQRLPPPLTAEQDQLLQQEFVNRNDLGGNAFLLIRHTGMRIGECVDLSYDCLRSTGPDQWAV